MYILQIEIDDSKTCVKFTPLQYKRIYYSRLQSLKLVMLNQLDAICLLQMRTRNWQDVATQ